MEDSMTVSDSEYELSILRDEEAENPRNWDNLGKMVCWHRRYNLGDKHEYANPREFEKSEEYKNAFVILPIYLYDHSGITISNSDFGDRWDSGQIGYIYATAEQIRQYLNKELNEVSEERIADLLKDETKTYDQYLQGDVYRYIIVDKQGEEMDSCSGFYGDSILEVIKEMRENVSTEYEKLFVQMERHSSVMAEIM